MQIKLKLEDEVIDVPEDAEIEIDTNPAAEIENGMNQVDMFFDVMSNLEHLQNHVKKFGVTKEFLHLVNSDNSLSTDLGMTLPYYESDEEGNEVEDIEMAEIPETEEIVAAMEGLISSAKDKVVAFFKWIGEKLSQFWNWLKSLFSKKEKEVKVAQEAVKPETIAKEVVAKVAEAKKESSPNKTAADLVDDSEDDPNMGYNYIVKKVTEIYRTEKAHTVKFPDKKDFESIMEKMNNALASFGSLSIDGTSGKLGSAENYVKRINDLTEKDTLKLENGYLVSDGNSAQAITNNLESKIKESDLATLGFSGLDEFSKEGDRLIKLMKNGTQVQKFVKGFAAKADVISRTIEKNPEMTPKQISQIKYNFNVPFKDCNAINGFSIKMTSQYSRICLQYKQKVVAKLLNELRGK